MLKTILIILLIANSDYSIPTRGKEGKDYLIFGANSIQKIFFATSSNYSKNHDGKKAIDSDKKSYWVSKKEQSPHWIEIDFGTKRIMTKVVVYPGRKDNYNTIKRFILQFMYRDKWFDYAVINLVEDKSFRLFNKHIFDYTRYKKKVEIELGGIDASTFRIYIPEDATYKGYAAIAEIETYVGNNRLRYFDERLLGMHFPIKNGFLPERDYFYPNAPRKYRGGKHVGLDVYYHHTDDSYEPVKVSKKTPVLSADDGFIIRADLNYKPMSVKEWRNQSEYFRNHPRTFVKRSFGGIQVWIDHENGVITTYNHLSKIDDSIKKGDRVSKGQRIGWAGNSGLFGEAAGKDYGVHLHFEIWIDGHYLGYGMNIKDIKKYFVWIFSIHQ